MKFLDLIKEEQYLTPEQQRELKKAKTLFKALQNGVVKINHPMKDDGGIILRYQIHDNVTYRWETHGGKDYITIITNNIHGEGITIETDSEFAMKRYEKDSDSVFSEHMRHVVSSSIRRKFINFGINVHVNQSGFKFVLDKLDQEPINENVDKNRLISKAHKLNKVFRKGFFTMGIGNNTEVIETKFRYELPEKSDPSMRGEQLVIDFPPYDNLKDKIGDKFPLKIWQIKENGEEELLNDKMTNGDYASIQDNEDRTELSYIFNNILNYVQRRYRDYGVYINVFTLYSDKFREINEVSEEHINKKIQRGRAIYKLLKTGLIGSKEETDEPMFRYELSDDPSINYRDDLGLTIFVDRVKINQLNRAAVTASIGRIESKINQRFKKFDITLSYPSITSDDVETNIIEEMDNKIDKKVKAVYTAFKTGIVKGKVNQNDKYRYILPDDYTYNMYKQTLSGRDVVVVTPSEGIKVYYLHQNGEEILLPESSHPNTYEHVLNKVSNKTGQYNIYIKPTLQ